MPLSILRNTFRSAFLLCAVAIASSSTRLPAQAQLLGSNLSVEVTGLRNTQGQVCFSLFNGSRGFPDSPDAIVAKQCVAAIELIKADATEGNTEGATEDDTSVDSPYAVTFEGLEAGTYAVSILHDENEDDEIGTGAFGIPTEGFGFSRNPAIQMSAPEFSEAAIVVVGANTMAQIALIYF